MSGESSVGLFNCLKTLRSYYKPICWLTTPTINLLDYSDCLQVKSVSSLMQVPLPAIILWLLIDHLSFFTTGKL
jgi:hypothetical protein